MNGHVSEWAGLATDQEDLAPLAVWWDRCRSLCVLGPASPRSVLAPQVCELAGLGTACAPGSGPSAQPRSQCFSESQLSLGNPGHAEFVAGSSAVLGCGRAFVTPCASTPSHWGQPPWGSPGGIWPTASPLSPSSNSSCSQKPFLVLCGAAHQTLPS